MGPYEPLKVLHWSEMVRIMLSSCSEYEQFQGVGDTSNRFVPCKPTREKKRKTHRRKINDHDYIRRIQNFISSCSFTPYPPKRTIDKRVRELECKVSHLEKLYRGVMKKYVRAQSSGGLADGDANGALEKRSLSLVSKSGYSRNSNESQSAEKRNLRWTSKNNNTRQGNETRSRSVISDLKEEVTKEKKKQSANKKATSESLKTEEAITEILRRRSTFSKHGSIRKTSPFFVVFNKASKTSKTAERTSFKYQSSKINPDYVEDVESFRNCSQSSSNRIGKNYFVTTGSGYFKKMEKEGKEISKLSTPCKKSDGVVTKEFSNEVKEINELEPNEELFSEDSNLSNNNMGKNFFVTATKRFAKKCEDQEINCLIPQKISDGDIYEEFFSDDSNLSNNKIDKNYIVTASSGQIKEYQEEEKEIDCSYQKSNGLIEQFFSEDSHLSNNQTGKSSSADMKEKECEEEVKVNQSRPDSVAADAELLRKNISILKNINKQQTLPDNKTALHESLSRSNQLPKSEKRFYKSFKKNFVERSTSTEIKLVEKATTTVDIRNKQELLQINSQSHPCLPDISLLSEQETYKPGVPRRNKPQSSQRFDIMTESGNLQLHLSTSSSFCQPN